MFDAVPSLLAALSEGRADILVLVGDVETHGLEVQKIATSGFVAVMSRGVAPRQRGRVSTAELRKLRYLAWDRPDPGIVALAAKKGAL